MSFTKEETKRFSHRNTVKGVVNFTVDMVIFAGFAAGAVWSNLWYVQLACSVLMATMIAALFVVGHDAAHDSLTPHKWLNRLIGTLCFLPSMHPYSLWVELHNYRHHRWTNLRGKDDVWIPLDPASYAALPSYQQLLYRIYRGPFGSFFYYLIEFWWHKFSWPTKKHYDPIKREYVFDTVLMWAVAIVYVGGIVALAQLGYLQGGPRAGWTPVLFGAVLPFFLWNAYSAVSTYLQHTHPSNVYYDDIDEWRTVSKAHTAIHASFPKPIRRAFHFIMEHSVHHLRPGVPLYNLNEAQDVLEDHDVNVIHYTFTPKAFMDIVRRCKLYNYEEKRWMDFQGRCTSPAPSAAMLGQASQHKAAEEAATIA